MKTTTKIAVSEIKESKTRSVLISMAIFLTTLLLILISLGARGMMLQNKLNAKSLYGDYEGGYIRVTQEKLEAIKDSAYFYDIASMDTYAPIETKKGTANLSYVDKRAIIKAVGMELEEGKFPETGNEIASQQGLFELLGAGSCKIGDVVEIPYRLNGKGLIIKKEFKISGILKSTEAAEGNNIFAALTSEEFYKQQVPAEKRSYSVSFKLYGGEDYGASETEDRIKELAKEFGIEDRNVAINSGYLLWAKKVDISVIASVAAICAVIITFAILVIYNIFYVGVVQRVQEYGKLLAMGASKKQLRQILLKQGMLLTIPGVILGNLIGALTIRFFLNWFFMDQLKNVKVEVTMDQIPLVSISFIMIVTLVIFAAVAISLGKPMKMAAGVSPVEAMRYQEGSGRKKQRKGHREIHLFTLTTSVLSQNKKRTITTICTMGLGCILFVIMANIASSMDPVYEARQIVDKGDFKVIYKYSINDETYPENNLEEIQKRGLIEELKENVNKISGVEKVETRKLIKGEVLNLKSEDKTTSFEVLSREDVEKKAGEGLELGSMDYDRMVKENGIIFEWGHFLEENGLVLEENYDFTLYNGSREKVPFQGKLMGTFGKGNSDYYMTEDTADKLGISDKCVSILFVTAEKGMQDSVQKQLEGLLAENDAFEMQTYADRLDSAAGAIKMLKYPSYALLGVLGLVGFLNMANTLITSIITRKKELGVLGAVGMSGSQLNWMLQTEGIVFSAGTLCLSLIIGNVIGYQCVMWAKNNAIFGVEHYSFPLEEIIFMVITVVLLQGILSFILSRRLQKESLVERIRYE